MKTPTICEILAILLTLFGSVNSLSCPNQCSCYPDPESRLGVIDCSNLGLKSIPKLYYPKGGNIGKIDMSHNLLTSLDFDKVYAYIKGLNVDELDFSSNLISDVTGTVNYKEGIDYVTLNLANNAFTTFPQNVIPVEHSRSNLVLDFSNNRLTELSRYMFAGGSDKVLYGFQFLAKNNRISQIDDEAFQGVKIVDTILDLRSNLLTTLSPTFQSPAGVREFRLSGNPWNCDCNLRWIVDPHRFLVNYTSVDPPACVTPTALEGTPIFSLTPNEFACLPYKEGSLLIEIDNQDSFTLSCPATADPPNPDITWAVRMPNPSGGAPFEMVFTSDKITFNSVDINPKAAFTCTASNNAGSVVFDLDVRVNGESGITNPGSG